MVDALQPVTLDLGRLRDVLLRRREPDRVFQFEHGIAANVKDEIAARFSIDGSALPAANEAEARWAREIAVQRALGFEIFRVWLPGAEFDVAGSLNTTWGEEGAGPIQSWDDFDRYPWPDPAAIDYSQLEFYEKRLPDDMGVYHVVKGWEVVRELFGFASFCVKMYEEPDLVEAVIRRVGEFHVTLTETLCQFRSVFAVYGADDYAYKTSTMMSPGYIVDHLLPWHARMSELAHAREKLYFFHCCGKVDPLMDHLIDEVKIDAKHSFEENVVPVVQAKRRWGDRLGLLGGLDVDFIARQPEEAIRQRVRETLDACQPGGGYCLGLGNWVTSYIPVDNYLAVLDEARRYG